MALILNLLVVFASLSGQAHSCATCHPKEVAGYARSAMAHSLSRGANQPDGAFVQTASGTQFVIHSDASGMWQSYQSPEQESRQHVAYTIGSGSHAFGYLIQIGDHLFQSPLSYYVRRHAWDMAPGYEQDKYADFTRPVTEECLLCHSGKPLPIAGTLNRYAASPFAAEGITCDRCHGSTEAHLKNPVPGSIVNPAKLTGAVRSSICEQCHLTGELRIPNPGKSIADFRPGETLEDSYTTYLGAQPAGPGIKVVSQAEQLARSVCARSSAGRLWCGSCHNPHDKPAPAQAAAYYRERCLTCHRATLAPAHAAPGRDCVACHMPQQPAKDGGHTAFTDHRIARDPHPEPDVAQTSDLRAWREPPAPLRERNLSLALITLGLQNGSAEQALRGFQLLRPLANQFPDDPAMWTSMGSLLLRAGQAQQALPCFEKALALRPRYAPYEVNVAAALLELDRKQEAIGELQKTLEQGPLLREAVELLAEAYREEGQPERAGSVLSQYRNAMGIKTISH